MNELATGGGSALGTFEVLGLKESEDAEPMDLACEVGRELNAPDAKAPALSALFELDDDPKALAADSLKPLLELGPKALLLFRSLDPNADDVKDDGVFIFVWYSFVVELCSYPTGLPLRHLF